MRRLILALAFLLIPFRAVSRTAARSDVTIADVREAIAQGTIPKPNPPVLRFIVHSDAAGLDEQVKDFLVWYNYKGVLYATLFGGQATQAVLYTPNGRYANGGAFESDFVIPN
jgi:hypothetical protein